MRGLIKNIFWYVLVPIGVIYMIFIKGPELMDRSKKSHAEKTQKINTEAEERAGEMVDRNWADATGSPPKVDTQKANRIADQYKKRIDRRIDE